MAGGPPGSERNDGERPGSGDPSTSNLAPGSDAEENHHRRKGLPGATSVQGDAIVPGIPATPAHDLVFHGGRIMPNLRFVNFYVGGDVWASGDTGAIDHALAAAMSDPNLNDVMAQYFSGGSITSTFDGSNLLPGPGPSTVSQGDAEVLVGRLHTDGQLAGRDLATTVVNLLLPQGTVLTDGPDPTGSVTAAAKTTPQSGVPVEDTVDSLHGLGGYHGSVHLPGASGRTETVYYAVGVRVRTSVAITDDLAQRRQAPSAPSLPTTPASSQLRDACSARPTA